MDNFDLKKYLANNPLLKEDNSLLNEEILNEINVLDIIKKVIKKRYGVDATTDQIVFADGSSVTDPNSFKITNSDLNVNQLAQMLESSGIFENTSCSLEEAERGMINEVVTARLCLVGVMIIATLLKTFPILTSEASPDYARRFVKLIFDGKMFEIMDQVVDTETQDSDKYPIIFRVMAFPKHLMGLFTIMVAAAIRVFRVAGEKTCATLIGVDSLALYIINKVVPLADSVEGEDANSWRRTIERLIKKFNETGREI
jgi:hypothetical protein